MTIDANKARGRLVNFPPKKVVFFGTPELSVRYLSAIVAEGYEVVSVITQPQKRRGRGGELTRSPVHQCADELGLPVAFRASDALEVEYDLGIVIAYGRIIPPSVFERYPHINIHYSLLPKYRGAAPMERAILDQVEISGVCLMEIAQEVDSGGVFASVAVSIADLYLSEVEDKLTSVGEELLLGYLGRNYDWTKESVAQVGEPTYAQKIDPSELLINWESTASHVVAQVRLERAFCFVEGRRIRIERAHVAHSSLQGSHRPGTVVRSEDGEVVVCGEGAVVVETVRVEGKRSTDFRGFLNGVRDRSQLRFTSV